MAEHDVWFHGRSRPGPQPLRRDVFGDLINYTLNSPAEAAVEDRERVESAL